MIRLFLSLCSFLPLKINHIFGALIGNLLYFTSSEAKKVSEQNIDGKFPHNTLEEKILEKNRLTREGERARAKGKGNRNCTDAERRQGAEEGKGNQKRCHGRDQRCNQAG